MATVDNQTDGTFNNNAGGTAAAVTNAGTASNAGTIAALANTAGTFTNTNTITGAADISGGTLETSGSVGGGGTNDGTINASGIFNGLIVNNAVFNVTGALTGDNSLTNTGSLNVTGGSFTGLTTLTNSGNTTVTAGQSLNATTFTQTGGLFSNDGTFTGDTVIGGGLLTGNGTFNGNVTGNAGGTISPGDSIGTQIINGDLTLNAGSTLAIEVTQGAADQLDVNGAVALNGATLQLDDLAPAAFDATQDFVIINNDGTDAVTGAGFTNVVDNLAFLDANVLLDGGDGNDVVLDLLALPIALGTVAGAPNQIAVGAGLESANNTDPGIQALLAAFQPLTIAQAQSALNSLSGEIHASGQFAFNSNGLFVGDSIINVIDGFSLPDRATGTGTSTGGQSASTVALQALALAPGETAERLFAADLVLDDKSDIATPDKRKFVFSRGLFRDVQIEADGNGGQTDIQNRGFIAGGGWNFNDRFQAGVSVGYLRSEFDIDSNNSDIDADSAIINAFARYNQGAFDGVATLGYIYSDVDSERGIAVGALNATANANYDANTVFGSGEIGYTAVLNRFAFRPFVSGGFSVTDRDGFTETGAGAANLAVLSATNALGQVTIGTSASTSFTIKSALIVPRVEVAFDQLIGDVTPGSTATFLPGGAAFTVTGAEPGSSRGRVNVGIATKFTQNFTSFIDYQGTFSSNDTEHIVRSGLRFRF